MSDQAPTATSVLDRGGVIVLRKNQQGTYTAVAMLPGTIAWLSAAEAFDAVLDYQSGKRKAPADEVAGFGSDVPGAAVCVSRFPYDAIDGASIQTGDS